MAINMAGYGGEFHLYQKYGQLVSPPNIPREYTSLYIDEGKKFVYSRSVTDLSRGSVDWQEMNTIDELSYPIGFHGLNYEESIARIAGYIPVLAICIGISDMLRSIYLIFNRVILNKNSISEWKSIEHESGIALLKTRHIIPVELCALQRFTILLNGIGIFFRGLITLGQIGIIFAPVDYYSWTK